MNYYSEILMAQGTRRKQDCNESMEKLKPVKLSSHATILKSGGVKVNQNTVSDTPLGKLSVQSGLLYNHQCQH